MWKEVDVAVERHRELLVGHTVDLRTSAMAVAVGRVANVALERGIWP